MNHSRHFLFHLKIVVDENSDKGIAGPLSCWDFFMESHYRRMEQAESYTQLQQFANDHNWNIQWNLQQLVIAEQRVVIVTDPAQIIRFASTNMMAMNGYTPEEVLGHQPKMFQGKDTDPSTRNQIREAIIKRIPFKGTIVNYRKNGAPYNCLVEEYPVWNGSGKLVHFIAFEKIA